MACLKRTLPRNYLCVCIYFSAFWLSKENGTKLMVTDKHIYIYIHTYIVLFGPVKPELGVIPSGQENHSKPEHLNFPGKEL